ncbi:DUF748 domain-containing protein [Saccharophagus degradans]|uniref:DUF748 domain-containing protein n=1 Tax=Saccharophagus degradans TaxID=86304 RepID=A0AAW7X7L3_9GAMM|nr:DUF748 domain-containing protein [Saccharophagus degradans]MDO6423459.1 DUF748 domain-containing protein [Saccharophagus degradans]MDO6606864.1 DUF748 domain-containing protein [Saccharophagus degradans]
MKINNRLLHSKAFIAACILFTLLVALRMLAPTIVKNIVNQSLDNAPGIAGSIQDIDLHLYRGAYQIEGIELRTVKNNIEHPFVTISELDISIFWTKLIRGEVVTELVFKQPSFTFADTKEEQTQKYEAAANKSTWLGISEQLVPFDIDRLEVIDGHFTFEGKSNTLNQKGVFQVSDINGVVVGITSPSQYDTENNKSKNTTSTRGTLTGYGMVYGESKVTAEGSFDPFSKKPMFDVDAHIDDIQAKHLDALIKIYTPFDIEAGSFMAATELKADMGKLTGYLKVGADELDVFSWKQDIEIDGDNPFEALADALIGGIANILSNRETDLVATQIPIEGSLNNPETSVIESFLSLLNNAFIDAIDIEVDEILSFGADQKTDSKK